MADKKRRIAGEAYWKMWDAVRELEKIGKEYGEWKKKKAREIGCYIDQWNSTTGKIMRDDCRFNEKGQLRSGTVDRAPDETIDEDKGWQDKMDALQEKILGLRKSAAARFGTWVDLIDPSTGEVKDEDVEVVVEKTKNCSEDEQKQLEGEGQKQLEGGEKGEG